MIAEGNKQLFESIKVKTERKVHYASVENVEARLLEAQNTPKFMDVLSQLVPKKNLIK